MGLFDQVIGGVTGSQGESSSTSPLVKALLLSPLLLLLAAKALPATLTAPKLRKLLARRIRPTQAPTRSRAAFSGRAEFERAEYPTQTPHEWRPS